MQQERHPATAVGLEFLKNLSKELNTQEIDLPPFPDTYARILQTLQDPDLSMIQLGRVVTTAPDLCVKILRMANSVILNRSGIEVTDVNVAVARLGADAVRNATVALATSVAFTIPAGSPYKQKLDQLREVSVSTAAHAHTLAIIRKLTELKDDALLTGLLHNVGAFYMLSRLDRYPEFANDEVIQAWNPGIGYAIIQNWGFPEPLAKAVEQQDLRPSAPPETPGLRELLVVSLELARSAHLPLEVAQERLAERREMEPAFELTGVLPHRLEHLRADMRDGVSEFIHALK